MSNKTFKRIMIAGCTLLAFAIIVTCIMNAVINSNKKKIYAAMEQNLSDVLKDDEYVSALKCSDITVTIVVTNDFCNLTNKEQLCKTEYYQAQFTLIKSKYFNDENYGYVHVMTNTGIELVKADSKGQIKIVEN